MRFPENRRIIFGKGEGLKQLLVVLEFFYTGK